MYRMVSNRAGVLSPILFTVYIDELLSQLSTSHKGCYIGDTFCGALGYADDVILLSPTVSSLNEMLSVCRNFAKEYDVLFNSSKSKLLYYGNPCYKPTHVSFMGSNIDVVVNEKHLGNIIGHKCIKQQLNDCINMFVSKVNMVHSHFNHVNHYVRYEIFKTYCMPLYGSQLWDFNHNYVNKFYVCWRKAIRKLFCLPYNAHCDLLPYICNDNNPNIQLYHRFISFVKCLSLSKNHLSSLCYNMAVNGSCSAVSNNMSLISSVWNIARENICKINKKLNPFPVNDDLLVVGSVISDLLYMKYVSKFLHGSYPFDNEDIEFMITTLSTE
jgi:hypothetical protein